MATLPDESETFPGIPVGDQQGCSDADRLRVLLRRLMLALLAAGVLWRSLRYLLRFPLWGDEALLCLNFLELDYGGLTRELRFCQVSPLLFLWGERTSLLLFGGAEWSMRLLPFLAGLGSLLLFWRLARLTLPPLAATLAVGFLAVAIWPVSMGTFAKPYAFDLLMPLLLLLPAAHWLKRPERLRWLIVLSLTTPLALFGSYPVVFVAGAISLGLLATAWRQSWKSRLLWAVYNALLIASFLGHYRIVGQSQLHTPTNGTTTERGMQAFWADGFPPTSPPALAKWLLLIHTGQMMAYPLGAADGGSSLTTLLCLVGAWRLWTSRRRALLVLCAVPFALGLVAGALHRYPYGASCRLSQHVAPAVCLSAGMGAAALLERLQSASLRRRGTLGVCTLLFLVGVGGMVRDVMKPYRDPETQWTWQVMRDFAADLPSGAPIVVLNKPEEVDALFRWYIELYGDRVSWHGNIDWARARASGRLICLHYRFHQLSDPEQMPRAPARSLMKFPVGAEIGPEQGGQSWLLAKAVTDTGVPPSWRDPVKHLNQFHWIVRDPGHQPAKTTVARR
jgi:hypothetical protein